jgi:hypothetical protein
VRSHRVHIGIEAAEAVDRIGCPQVAKRIPGGEVDTGSGQNQSALWDVYSGGELSCGLLRHGKAANGERRYR